MANLFALSTPQYRQVHRKIPNMVEAWAADCNKWEQRVKFLSKYTPKIPSRRCGVCYDTWKLHWKQREKADPWSFSEEEFCFVWIQLQFIHQHQWQDKGQRKSQTNQCYNRVVWCQGHIITKEIMRNCVSRDHMTKQSGIEGEGLRTKNSPPGDSTRYIKLKRTHNHSQFYHLTSAGQVRWKPIKCFPSNPKPVRPRQLNGWWY